MYDTEFLDLPPLACAAGEVHLPGSKSISNRVLLLAALSRGQTTVHDLLASDDTAVMLTALKQLGCTVVQHGQSAVIGGLGGQLIERKAVLFMGNAGTAMRPLTAALALLGGEFELSGVPRMHERPIGDLVDALRQLGCVIEYVGNEGFPPLRLSQGVLKLDQTIRVRGDVSSQFLTALLMALPLVARQAICIEVTGELISRPYIEITLNLLKRFGIQVKREGWQRFTIPAGSVYQSPGEIHVEADASSASYFIALGAIAASENGQNGLKILGVGADSIQGDIRFIEAARVMGARIDSTANSLHVSRGAWPLKSVDMDCNHMPDAAMTLAVMALYAEGTTVLRNIGSWRVKETDRIAAMACELQKLGATIEEGADYLKITPPGKAGAWNPAVIHTYDDHRIAMCFSLAAFNPAKLPVRILDPKCVAKTFPDYFETLFSVTEAQDDQIPVICLDGPTASGKGTLAALTAHHLGYHYLDSGALYRLSAFAALRAGLSLDDGDAIAQIARALPVRFKGDRIFLTNGDAEEDVSEEIRTEVAGMAASRVSAYPQVRDALLDLQRSFRQLPGLVADGRDMGTVVFPKAPLKIYLTASALHRAERRYKQLISKGNTITIAAIQQDLEARDQRDMSRKAAPLRPADNALLLDNSDLTIEQSLDLVMDWWQGTRPF
ncbi:MULTISPECIES: bifunctional 3-phosphoshikimate 1-carboxyvinyltransferase/cytidylate kinase [unclassified Polaromonas]|uniref:bifunctional 3-phosphoshikimate 1-carboxyvinyltransferase/cytidylate kinase n=1 Tax=unclassified Polaromonas TaxID=2638319 RepID=UPI0018C9973C|nr:MULTISPECIES: bifunctional 3-phosphoshikimate 1-carboxyvinyltransferase/cytidylate kinase [unclassified Polaromonas]MBG6073853.1 3-phosphoshikimate 1-carboxyvinyltransferase [Polaromonas sp. CG_9.7]MBG6115712.1 3-phosphoshikimate 1-carboxyvinyltransferase [Polaromonas sp. CG_9.2]MDH6185905.1 3-phosphoshikimate 1-carboxyvinyltransferase [Polaromonas sp. CG_23.6]